MRYLASELALSGWAAAAVGCRGCLVWRAALTMMSRLSLTVATIDAAIAAAAVAVAAVVVVVAVVLLW